MTVKYLQTMQRNQMNVATANVQNDPTVYLKFKAGFSDCRNEVVRYISQIDGVDANVKQRLMGHLNNCVTGIQQVATPYSSLSGSSGSPSEYGIKSIETFAINICGNFQQRHYTSSSIIIAKFLSYFSLLIANRLFVSIATEF